VMRNVPIAELFLALAVCLLPWGGLAAMLTDAPCKAQCCCCCDSQANGAGGPCSGAERPHDASYGAQSCGCGQAPEPAGELAGQASCSGQQRHEGGMYVWLAAHSASVWSRLPGDRGAGESARGAPAGRAFSNIMLC
jgi:hypothetical protein